MAIPTAHMQWSPAGVLQQLFVFDEDDAFVLEARSLDDVDADVFEGIDPRTARAWLIQRHINHEWRSVPTPAGAPSCPHCAEVFKIAMDCINGRISDVEALQQLEARSSLVKGLEP
jgi:hypothetical protein